MRSERVWSLTALLDGLVAPVGTVSGLVAHLAHLDTLPAAALELLWPVTLSHCGWKQQKILKSGLMKSHKLGE